MTMLMTAFNDTNDNGKRQFVEAKQNIREPGQ